MIDRQAGYDRVLTVFNPDGRLLQLEYAHRVVDRAQPIAGVVYEGGVVIGGIKAIDDKLLDIDRFHKITRLSDRVLLGFAGISSDARILIEYGRVEIESYKLTYDEEPRVLDVANRLATIMHIYTLYASIRPFGVSFLMGGVDDGKGELFLLVPGGYVTAYRAWSIGMGSMDIRRLFEREHKDGMDRELAIRLVIKSFKEVNKKIEPKDIEIGYVEREKGLEILGTDEVKEYLEGSKE